MYSAEALVNVLKDKQELVGVEIGCHFGDSSIGLMRDLPNIKKLTSVDPYVDYVDWNGVYENTREQCYMIVSERLPLILGEKYELVREYSDDYAKTIDDNSLDFIFIDGLHTYEQVLADCKNYYPKMKSGAFFSGHDYSIIPGVTQAVDEFVVSIGKNVSDIIRLENNVWGWFKD